MLEAREICKTFRRGWGRKSFLALDNVSLQIDRGETLGLIGPSGCGKSTLARILLRLIPSDGGGVVYKGENITLLKGKALLPFRGEVQLISQRPESFFNPVIKLRDSVLEPLKIFRLYEKVSAHEKLSQVLEQVKLNDSLLERYPHQVSGGEIQRLSICRALMLQPRVLVLDEATSMLDVSVQAQILHILKDLQKTRQLSYLFISHDREVVDWMSDRVVEMRQGRI
ncbi:dipeptide/oligopeptide/nickel ABC transporter ATP-binding protein [Desulfosporosinus burensis]